MIKKYICLHVLYPLFFSDFNKTWIFSIDFRKLLKYLMSRKFVQWEPSCSMRKDGRTDRRIDMTKLIVAFHNFVSAPKTDTSSMSLILTRNFTRAANFAVKIVHCPLCTVHCALRTVHCPLCTVHCVLSTVHCALSTVHSVHCALGPTSKWVCNVKVIKSACKNVNKFKTYEA